ncbi:hypothetical protein BIV57_18220 [Mangrovactinospora gilvigrisea]|uniref:Uncharacterized protein n=1 Tax=Mangrovactinospora gilvigrisea TaxID=1428644 RepID=A0A1J7BBN7_9ACTN|nr:hypothetical protein [Mangrovactinospora gilvigrisea]OIV36095.1 hypothetical protein BIV57_18220 [Mangrovactinospora gilvigrisea]
MALGGIDCNGAEVVRVPTRHGLEAVDILRLRGACGPVLHDADGRALGFLVPPGTAAAWTYPGSAIGLPPGASWLVAPVPAAPRTTDPGTLRAALDEASTTLAAADTHP